jgi:hypothetical protein
MRIDKDLQLTRFRSCVRFTISLILILGLFGNSPVLALPRARPGPELAPSPAPAPTLSLSVMDDAGFAPGPRSPDAPPSPDARALPADMGELPELVDQRTANSATFQVGPARYATIVDAGALHYLDSQGAWQIIDPVFRPAENGYVVEHNSIRSRAGRSTARLSAAADDTIITWQATTLGAVMGQTRSRFIPLAKALDEPPGFAQKREDGRVLRYAGGWSDPSLAEEIVSAPDSLEQALILSQPPRLDRLSGFGTPDYLEMRATLKLLPGAELWADGQRQAEAFETAGGLEVRNAAGTATLVFDPVLAFEFEQPDVAVGGTYIARPGDEPGVWTIGLRTPWRWWIDPARRYPAVIDPTMHVLRTTGYGDGIAWVANGSSGNPDTTDQALHFGEMVLGSWAGTGRYSGYVQFNSIPYMLTNAPISVTHAYLDVEPSHVRMPYYSGWEGIDFEMYPTQHTATLYDLGQCPGDCNGFSLVSEPVGYDWNTVPTGTPSFAKPLAGPALKGSGKTSITTWDVTDMVRTWNQQNPRPDDGPAFRLTVDTNCPTSNFEGESAKHVRKCTRLVIPAGNVRLRIEYDELPIAVNESFLNSPGVPSFYDGVFEEGTTSHAYDLAIPAGPVHWRAAAVRGNHAIQPALPTRTGLKLVDHGSGDVDLVNGTVQGADQTAVVLIDEHNPNNLIEAADLWAEVTASNDNDFANDGDRNYRIEHQGATDWNVGYSAWVTKTISFKTDRLINLGEFDLATGDNVIIRVTAPVTFPLTLGLAAPTSGSDKADSALGNVNLDKKFEPEGQPVRDKSFTVQTTGKWALALINQGRPVPHPLRPTEAIAQQVVVEMLRCPLGTIATARWICQPVILPGAGTPSASVLGLTIYSEGGFTADPAASDTWCTQNEGNGTPIIGPDADGRWVVVGQGSVCRDGDVISTTEDSGIGLGIEILNPKPFPDGTVRAKIPPTFIYGSTAYYPLPDGYPTGVVVYDPDSGRLVPETDTRRNFAPFDQYWGTVFTPGEDYISTSQMKALGGGMVSAAVTVDAAAEPVSLDWDVPWSLFPEEAAQYKYVFDVQPSQSPALPSPALLASLKLRILDAGNAATGLIEGLDAYKLETNVDAGQFRASKAKVTQDDALGGASKNIQVVVQPPGASRLPANEKSCSHGGDATSCLDLRRDDYDWNNGGGDKNVQPWELPDVHIEDSAGTMMFSRPGDLQIFSVDHPNATEMEQSFSFDTWGATVSVKEEACTQGGPIVSVVRGSASIALPSVGDDGSGGPPSVQVNFKLCQAELRQAQLILEIPAPGIAVGSTGVGVNLIGGTVILDPDFTQIELQLGFQTMDGATVTGGTGRVLIDTRGLFELQVTATIVGILDADLLLRVAWNPLDVLLEAGVSCCGGLISGGLRMHAWIGQGWQNKYSWLPDNDDFHFAGSIEATLKIPEGYIGDVGIAELPPFDFTRAVKIAFGEFCTNDSCTSYAWGMSVVFTVVGVDVGLYVDGDGPEFILGTDDHVLIDQFGSGGNSLVQARAPNAPAPPPYEIVQPGNWQVQLIPPFKTPVDAWPIQPAGDYGCTGMGTSVHTCPVTITAEAGRALFTIAWENGNLEVALINPSSDEITPENAAMHGVVVSETSTSLLNQVSFGVPEAAIASGLWQVQMSNVITDPQATFQTNYQILYASEPPPPTLIWNSPTGPTSPGVGGSVILDWTALRGTQPLTPATKIELFYTPMDQKPVTPTLMTGTLIVNQITATLGTYAWDTNGLASGEYAVGGRIDDHQNANGHIVAWAPGSIVINDTTPPPVPVIVGQTDLKDALIVTWLRDNSTPDLAGYLVEYTIPNWDEGADQLPRVRRILPHSPDQWPWFERIRLGGLLTGQPTTVCVRAYDASGNVSACDPFTHHLPVDRPPTLGPPRRITAYGEYDPAGDLTLLGVDWMSPDPATGTPAGYALSYNLAGCVLPGASSLAEQGPSPIDVGDVLAYQLIGLTVGQTYRLAVNGYTGDGYVGPQAETTVLFVAPTDDDGDGLPDQWAELYGLTGGADDDPDGDGLPNEEELLLKSNPINADSDGDGYYDGEEVDWGTAVCGPEHPPYHYSPKLTLVGRSNYKFVVASSQMTVAPQELLIFNMGGGTLYWSAMASQPWITLGSEGGSGQSSLSIGVDPGDLDTGHYTGTITLLNLSERVGAGPNQALAEQEEATIEVSLSVLPAKNFGSFVFLPLVVK